jgi:hypothetical protein
MPRSTVTRNFLQIAISLSSFNAVMDHAASNNFCLKEIEIKYIGIFLLSYPVSFVDKMKSNSGKELPNCFLSYCIFLSTIRTIPSSDDLKLYPMSFVQWRAQPFSSNSTLAFQVFSSGRTRTWNAEEETISTEQLKSNLRCLTKSRTKDRRYETNEKNLIKLLECARESAFQTGYCLLCILLRCVTYIYIYI